jgi:hypothetical protein
MPVLRANGSVVSINILSVAPDPDPIMVVEEDLYKREPYNVTDHRNGGSGGKLTLLVKAGTPMRRSAILALFPLATIEYASVTTAPVTAGTEVVIRGRDMQDVTDVRPIRDNGDDTNTVLPPITITSKSAKVIRGTLPAITGTLPVRFYIEEPNGDQEFPEKPSEAPGDDGF